MICRMLINSKYSLKNLFYQSGKNVSVRGTLIKSYRYFSWDYYSSVTVFAFLTLSRTDRAMCELPYRPFAPGSVVIPEVDHKRFLSQILADNGFSDGLLDLNSWRKFKSEKTHTWNVEVSISAVFFFLQLSFESQKSRN